MEQYNQVIQELSLLIKGSENMTMKSVAIALDIHVTRFHRIMSFQNEIYASEFFKLKNYLEKNQDIVEEIKFNQLPDQELSERVSSAVNRLKGFSDITHTYFYEGNKRCVTVAQVARELLKTLAPEEVA